MTVKYKDIEYELRPFDIDTKKAFSLVVFEIDALKKIYLEGFDLSVKDNLDKQINVKEIAIKQLEALGNKTEEQVIQLDNLKKSLEEIYANAEYKKCVDILNDAHVRALSYVCLTKEIMRPFLNAVLIGDLTKLEWDWNINEFCQEVLMSFFFFQMKSRNE